MRQVMVRDELKPERVAENEELVRAVYDELRRDDPAGLSVSFSAGVTEVPAAEPVRYVPTGGAVLSATALTLDIGAATIDSRGCT
jgi:hypothetical protein